MRFEGRHTLLLSLQAYDPTIVRSGKRSARVSIARLWSLPFFNSILDYEALDRHRFMLAQTMNTIVSLGFGGVIPGQVQAAKSKDDQ